MGNLLAAAWYNSIDGFILLIIHLFMIFKVETFNFEVLLNQAIYTFLL